MEQYFNVRYEFDKAKVHNSIAQHVKGGQTWVYLCGGWRGSECGTEGRDLHEGDAGEHLRHLRQQLGSDVREVDIWP